MIPTGGQAINEAAETAVQPSKTYKLDLENGRILGKVDGIEAIRQAVLKIILTERYDYLAYSTDYGVEHKGLLGRSAAFVQSELRRRIPEALFQDERIEAVQNMTFVQAGDELTVSFTVVTSEGSFNEEVSVSV